MPKTKRILITSGDHDGIGLEVTLKALNDLGPQKEIQFFVFRSKKSDSFQFSKKIKKFKVHSFNSWPEALAYQPKSHKELLEICSPLGCAKWVEVAAAACLHGQASALVTAPMSKQAVHESGLKDMGHTGILRRISGKSALFMGFLGDKFNVILATEHIPVSEISVHLTPDKICGAIDMALQMRKFLSPTKAKKPIAVLGLNPHASDQGLIGDFEEKTLLPILKKYSSADVWGPIVPDAAFTKENQKRFSVFVCCYHDQGLIPFKAIHGYDSGVHTTMGLPFIRTSVDHGTAKDIFGKNKANPKSMTLAIKQAIQWSFKNSP